MPKLRTTQLNKQMQFLKKRKKEKGYIDLRNINSVLSLVRGAKERATNRTDKVLRGRSKLENMAPWDETRQYRVLQHPGGPGIPSGLVWGVGQVTFLELLQLKAEPFGSVFGLEPKTGG